VGMRLAGACERWCAILLISTRAVLSDDVATAVTTKGFFSLFFQPPEDTKRVTNAPWQG